MYKIAARIRELYEEGAVHRKGFCIRNATSMLAASNAVEELGELLVELILYCDSPTVERLKRIDDELSDVLAVVTHLTMMIESDLTPYKLASDRRLQAKEQKVIEKINSRFSV